MPTFSSRPLGGSGGQRGSIWAKFTPKVRQQPFVFFGLPFLLTIVAGSYGLSALTQTRYDYNASKVQSMSKEEELGMRKDRRKIDIREEYFRLQAKDSELENWEPKRIPRPQGVPEWGVAPNVAPSPESTDSPSTRTSSRKLHAEERPQDEQDNLTPTSMKAFSSPRGATVLGPDGKPCRACNSKLAFSAAMRGSRGSTKETHFPNNSSGENKSTHLQDNTNSDNDKSTQPCPPDGDALGQSTWTFLHSAAAYYPEAPTSTQQSAMLDLIRALPHVYPCHTCADALKDELGREKEHGKSWEGGAVLKTAVRSGPGMRKWLCGLHNEVNFRLGKPTWRCDETTHQRRWLDGPEDGSCD